MIQAGKKFTRLLNIFHCPIGRFFLFYFFECFILELDKKRKES